MSGWKANVLVLMLATATALVILVEGSRLLPAAGRIIPALDASGFNIGEVTRSDINAFWKFGPHETHLNRPLPGVDNLTWTFTTNNLGLRGADVPPKSEAFRILALGDSTTFGVGLADEECWPAVLQSMATDNVEVINGGMPGSSSFQGLSFLLTEGLSLQPDLVIVTFGFNDMRDAEHNDLQIFLSRDGWKVATQREVVEGMDATSKQDPRHRRRLTDGEYTDAMIEIGNACKRRGIRVLYVAWPYEYAVKHGLNSDDYIHLIPHISSVTGSPMLSLADAFRAASERPYIDPIHANAAGCRLVAGTIKAYLQDNNMLSRLDQTTE